MRCRRQSASEIQSDLYLMRFFAMVPRCMRFADETVLYKMWRRIFTDAKASSRRQGNNGWLHAGTKRFNCLCLIPEARGFLFTILLLAASGWFCLSVLVSCRAEEGARNENVAFSAHISKRKFGGAILLVRIDSLENYISK